MSAELAAPRAVRDIVTGAFACAGAAIAVMASAATAVTLSEADDDLRRALRFGFAGVGRTPDEVVRIALHNARLAAATLLCAAAIPLLPRPGRVFLGAVLSGVLVLNAGIVGLALGAYGERLAVAVALHLPLEFGAFSIAGGSYLGKTLYDQ